MNWANILIEILFQFKFHIRVESEAASKSISPTTRRRLQRQVLTIKLPSPGGGQRLKCLGGPGHDFTATIERVTARNLVNNETTIFYHIYDGGMTMIESHLESNAKHEQIKCEKITMSINHVFWVMKKLWPGMSQDEYMD